MGCVVENDAASYVRWAPPTNASTAPIAQNRRRTAPTKKTAPATGLIVARGGQEEWFVAEPARVDPIAYAICCEPNTSRVMDDDEATDAPPAAVGSGRLSMRRVSRCFTAARSRALMMPSPLTSVNTL